MFNDKLNQYWFQKHRKLFKRLLSRKIELIILLSFYSIVIFTIDYLLGRHSYYITIIVIYSIWFSNSTISFLFVIFGILINLTKNNISKKNSIIKDNDLPLYTILIPLYKEAALISQLLNSLSLIDYPSDKLQILFAIESDDKETLIAYNKHYKKFSLPLELVVIPYSLPRTKPKACNIAIEKAKGEFVVIYDAESIIEPLQLRKAVDLFRKDSKNLACIQAQLMLFSSNPNLLSNWFILEYSNWFSGMLQSLNTISNFLPLGGNSNHFRRSILMKLNGWDSYNVTEDADLGVRIARAGYKIMIMNSTTYEEAVNNTAIWINQRSRWIKGFIQTYINNMLEIRNLHKEMDWKKIFCFHYIIALQTISMMLQPFIILMSLKFIFQADNNNLLSSTILYMTIYAYCMTIIKTFIAQSLTRKIHCGIVIAILTIPLYHILHSIAVFKAIYELVFNPYYWHKTQHFTTKNMAVFIKRYNIS